MIPILLTLFFLLDAAFRILPVELLSFRVWEAATRYAPSGVPFEPNRRFRLPREYGDLANLGNLPHLREYRAGTTFTTDAIGFRNTLGAYTEGDIDAILVGDSFGVGASVSDEETLAVQLGAATGCKIYNAAGSGLLLQEPLHIIKLAQHLGIRRGLVIEEFLESPMVTAKESPARGRGATERLTALRPPSLLDHLGRLQGLWSVSPVQIFLNRWVRVLEDDRTLPNSYASTVVQRTLRNGEAILFAPEDIESARNARTPSIDHWVRLGSTLDTAGLKLLVVLVPRKYTVYQALLLDEALSGPPPGGALERLERQLQGAEISVVNLTEVFRTRAAAELDRGAYLYWRDDTHWNARGIAVAASEIGRLRPGALSRSCRSGW